MLSLNTFCETLNDKVEYFSDFELSLILEYTLIF